MPYWKLLFRRLYHSLGELRWWTLLAIFLAHLTVSYLLMTLAGEIELVGQFGDFLYFYMVTATTVGYGDLSPQSTTGRMLAVVFLLPGGIAIFTAVLGKLLSGISQVWRNRVHGFGDYSDRSGHVVVLGWQGSTTLQTLRLLHAERTPGEALAVLIAKDLGENPAGDYADYVRTERLADPDTLQRAGGGRARSIIVRGADDDETLAAVLIAEDCAPTAHIVSYFNDDRTAHMVKARRPRVEAISSLSEELLSRSARDPGSSELTARLLSGTSSDTAFGLAVPPLRSAARYGEIFLRLKREHGATLVGLAHDGVTDLNCHDDLLLKGGETLYYISAHRLDPATVAWNAAGERI
jgi:voltage-gated potassium channel